MWEVLKEHKGSAKNTEGNRGTKGGGVEFDKALSALNESERVCEAETSASHLGMTSHNVKRVHYSISYCPFPDKHNQAFVG